LLNQHYYASGILFAPGQIPFLNLADPRSFAPLAVYAGLCARS
jgi:hypothetical protein